jgi:hypothetical protein
MTELSRLISYIQKWIYDTSCIKQEMWTITIFNKIFLLYDQLVTPYTVAELLLHATQHFLRGLYLGFFLLSVSLSARVLRWCVGFLSDIQEVRSQFLQLTARDAHQCPINGRHAIEEIYPYNNINALKNITVHCNKCTTINLKYW